SNLINNFSTVIHGESLHSFSPCGQCQRTYKRCCIYHKALLHLEYSGTLLQTLQKAGHHSDQ
ncbi:hypothetical protein ACH5RR_041210, partial [Cinchona calisaya]